MHAITMGQRNNVDDPMVKLIAGVFRQAAWDYRYAVRWLAAHQDMSHSSKSYKTMVKLRNDVKKFTKSDLFQLALGDIIEPETFLAMALKGQVDTNLREKTH